MTWSELPGKPISCCHFVQPFRQSSKANWQEDKLLHCVIWDKINTLFLLHVCYPLSQHLSPLCAGHLTDRQGSDYWGRHKKCKLKAARWKGYIQAIQPTNPLKLKRKCLISNLKPKSNKSLKKVSYCPQTWTLHTRPFHYEEGLSMLFGVWSDNACW